MGYIVEIPDMVIVHGKKYNIYIINTSKEALWKYY